MRKSPDQKGFTLLEVVVALLLFSLLMGSLWQFYGNTYNMYIKFDQKTDLSEQARIATNFIREEIRLADQVTIIETADGALTKIQLDTMDSTSSTKGKRELVLQTTKNDMGTYNLVYSANFKNSLISDRVDNIKVIREAGSPIVQFECTFAIVTNGETTQTVENVFSESLEYKIEYSKK